MKALKMPHQMSNSMSDRLEPLFQLIFQILQPGLVFQEDSVT